MSTAVNKQKYKYTGGYHPAILVVWAAIQAICNLFPSFPLIGIGGTMTIANCIIPLSGIFFGPFAGALVSAIAQIIGMLLNPSSAWLGMFTFLIGTCTAFVAGLLARKKWYFAYALNLLGIIIFYCFPVGREAWIKGVTFGIAGFVTCVIGGIFAKKHLTSKKPLHKFISVWACATGGLLTTCMFADICAIILFHTPAAQMIAMCIISPTERFIFGLGAAIIGVPLLIALPKIGVFIGPKDDDAEEQAAAEKELEKDLENELKN